MGNEQLVQDLTEQVEKLMSKTVELQKVTEVNTGLLALTRHLSEEITRLKSERGCRIKQDDSDGYRNVV